MTLSLYAARLDALRARMRETATDLVALGPSRHMAWVTGIDPHGDERPVLFVVSQSWAGFLMPALNVDSVRQHTDLPMIPWGDSDGPADALAQVLAATGVTTPTPSLVLDETMRTDFSQLVLRALPGANHRFTEDTVGWLRARKGADEYALLKASALLNDRACKAAVAALRPGVTEREIAEVVKQTYLAAGATPEFSLICFGANGAFPHHHTGNTVLGPKDAVLIDIGGRLNGYPSDMTRVSHMGDPSAEFRKVHAVLERAVQAAIAAAKPGVAAKTVDHAARSVIAQAGYGDFFLHRTGHGLGLDIHEPPFITGSNDQILAEGNVFSIEPGIYLAGKFGLRLEEVVILRNGKAEVLSELSRDIM